MNKTFFLLLLTFCSITFLGAQTATVKGLVKQENNNEPLIGVNVSVQGTNDGTTTDLDGLYELKLAPGSYTIVFTYVGYDDRTETVVLAANETKTLDIAFTENTNLLSTVVVSGSRYEKKLSEEIVSMDVIKPQFIEKQNITDLGSAVRRNPGVTIIDGQFNIRGGSGWSFGAGSRVSILLDGYPVLQPASGSSSGLGLPMESVGQIEIIKGAASALYGSSALNGIVNLRTAHATTDPETTIAFYGTVNDNPTKTEKYFDAAGNLQTEKIDKRWWVLDSVYLPGVGFTGKDTTILNENKTRPHSFGFTFSNRQKIGRVDLVMGGQFSRHVGMYWGTQGASGRFNVGARYNINTKWRVGINVNLSFGKGASTFLWGNYRGVNKYVPSLDMMPTQSKYYNGSVDPYMNYSDTKGNSHKILTRYLGTLNNNSDNRSNGSTILYGEYQYQRRIDKINMNISTGIVAQYNFTSKSPLYGNEILKADNEAFYVQLDNKFWKRLSTSVGFRLETNKMTDTKREVKPVFRVGVNVEAAKYTFIRASFGQGYRFPSIAERFILTDFSGFAIVPNPILKSETGFSAELGIKQGIPFGKNFNAFIDVAGFYTEYTNMMEFTPVGVGSPIPTPPGSVLSFASQNVGNTRIYGTEVSLTGAGKLYKFPTTLVIGYTYIKPEFKKFDPIVAFGVADYNILKYRFRHTFTAMWDIDFKGFGFGTNVQYFSALENYDTIFDIIGVGIEQFRNTTLKKNAANLPARKRFKGSATWDLRASYGFGKNSKYTLSFLVNNVLNKEFSLRPGILENNRTYTVRIEMKFK
ncbi:MAG TPA: TonB-dependent receptor [Chitinophagales bacterium]|nr:TonB-dependent receptor [Chitinophagales bacterium]HMW13840.1 TonB-dependent receptor [Chitinophagales bacterium]HMX60786.1 TonB-dependent receptor [Chitinophagales bacterium]HMY24361.1 TonB-dependent receptor [Chitinophagales bacterium]HMZ34698.1 TonB-dependent receptor [Chitinophagales bacterium]